MEVKNVYQDVEGKWHIEYSSANLIGLAFRVYIGQFLIGIFIGLPLILLISIVSAKSLHEEKNIAPPYNSGDRQESISDELSN